MSVNFEKAQAIFLAAVERNGPDEQMKYLDDACGEDRELRQHLEILLNAHGQSGSFLEKGALVLGPTLDQPITEKPGTQIGPYKLLQQLGEGGMGVVYMAEQKEPVKRRVALKIIKPGMDTRQVIVRFEAERQALAMMDHPNIAKVLDAGATESGRPYFIMELVNGISVTRYCDKQHLTPKQRLELFVPICQAVQHAHQKGIIHRDLKPSNVLVALYDGRPVPKVIDFGVAKATSQTLTEKTMFTQLGQIVGTLEYMSPEQAQRNQLDVDTRSDIYSLGVLLYELLTGNTPFDAQRLRSAAFDEMLRIIREEEPPKPSTRVSSSEALPSIAANRHIEPRKLTAMVRGELDWIVLKAMEKDRARRYETATGFAADIERYLTGEPVQACPPSTAYRFKKFVRRNTVAITTTAIVAISLLVGSGIATWQAIRATRSANAERRAHLEADRAWEAEAGQRAVAEQERDRATTAEELAKDEAERANREAANANTNATIAQAVNDFLNDDLLAQANPKNEPDRDIKLRTVLDQAAEKIDGRFTDQPLVEAAIRHTLGSTYSSLGEYGKAQHQFERASELYQHELGLENEDTLSSMNELAVAMREQGQHAEAEQLHREVIEIVQRVFGAEHSCLLVSMGNLANALFDQGRYAEAKKLRHEVLEIQQRVFGPEHPGTLLTRHNLASAILLSGQYAEAERLYCEVLETRQRVLGPEHPDTLMSMGNLASAINNQGRNTEAEVLYREVLEIEQRVLGSEHPGTLTSMDNLATAIQEQGRNAQAEKLHREVLAIQQRVLGPEHPDTLRSMHNLANVMSHQGRKAEAEELNRQTLEARNRVLGPAHGSTLKTVVNLTAVLSTASNDESVLATIEQVADVSLEKTKNEPDQKQVQDLLKMVAGNLANRAWLLTTHADAEQCNPQMAARLARLASRIQPDRAHHWNNLGVAQYRLGDRQAAVEALEKASEMRGGKDPVYQFVLAMTYAEGGKHEDAAHDFVAATLWLMDQPRSEEQYRLHNEAEELIDADAIVEYCTAQLEAEADSSGLYATRAAALARSGQTEKAAQDYIQALGLLPNHPEFERRGTYETLLRHPEVFSRVTELQPDDTDLWIARGRDHARHERWKPALADYEQASDSLGLDNALFEYACLLVLNGEDELYRELCQRLDRPSQAIDEVGQIIRICTLQAKSGVEPSRVVQWARTVSQQERNRYRVFQLGLAYYRAGQYEDAVASLNESHQAMGLDARRVAFPLSLAYQRLGQEAESQKWSETGLAKLTTLRSRHRPSLPTADWLQIFVWHSEAKAALGSTGIEARLFDDDDSSTPESTTEADIPAPASDTEK